MPQIGDLVKEKDLYPGSPHRRTFIWVACRLCGRERWVRLKKGNPAHNRCSSLECRKTFLKGTHRTNRIGKHIDPKGYIKIWVDEGDFFAPMRGKVGYVAEHRLVMARSLGRNLHTWEQVHHKDGEKHNNKIENLEILDKTNHIRDHSKGYKDGFRKGYLDGLKKANHR